MSIRDTALLWIEKHGIKSVINAPCGPSAGDESAFIAKGVTKVLNVDLLAPEREGCIRADLSDWKPSEDFDAVYINCIFCNNLSPPGRSYQRLAENYASWPVNYIIVYDTVIEHDWKDTFLAAGWIVKESSDDHESGPTRLELWGR